jgi:hypothetical protein
MFAVSIASTGIRFPLSRTRPSVAQLNGLVSSGVSVLRNIQRPLDDRVHVLCAQRYTFLRPGLIQQILYRISTLQAGGQVASRDKHA